MLGTPVPTRGRSGPLAAIAAAATTLALWPSLVSLHQLWAGIYDYHHGYLIAAVTIAWLAVVLRKTWAQTAQPSLLGSALMALTLYAWLIAFNANSLVLHQLLLPLAIWLAVFATTGWTFARQTIAPIAFLYFAVPVWEATVPVLQWLSVHATEASVGLLGIPARIEEYTVTIPDGVFQIIEGCSGKRYFMVTLALATLAGTVNGLKHWRLAGYIAASAALALLANWIRIAVVIYAGHVTHMQHYLVAREHRTFGQIVFVVLVVLVILLAQWLSRRAPAEQVESSAAPSVDAGRAWPSRWPVAVPLALLIATVSLMQARAANAAPSSRSVERMPAAAGAWEGPVPAQADWSPDFHQPDSSARVAYTSAAGAVEVFTAAYSEQHQGRELVNEGNTLLAPKGWQRTWPRSTTRLTSGAAPLSAFEARAGDGRLWLLAYTFEIGGWPTRSELLAQLAYGFQSFVKPAPAGVIALASRCDENCEHARTLVMSFWDDMSAPLMDSVPDHNGRTR